jgi:ubiquinol-cytochrome c reductase cytochrome b subunit
VANLGQMLLLHACLLPLVVGVIVVWHVLLVRRRGVVPPIDAVDRIDPADALREPVIPAAHPDHTSVKEARP